MNAGLGPPHKGPTLGAGHLRLGLHVSVSRRAWLSLAQRPESNNESYVEAFSASLLLVDRRIVNCIHGPGPLETQN